MLTIKKESLVGFFLSVFIIISFCNLTGLQAASRNSRSDIVKFAKEHKVFDTYKLSRRRLNKTITRLEYQHLVNKILFDLKVVKQIDVEKLAKLGIFSKKDKFRKISRKDALGILLRSMMYIWDNNLSTVKAEFSKDFVFRDYVAAPKYSMAMNFALDKALIRGMRNGRFYPERRLKLKNALILANRFYKIFEGKQLTQLSKTAKKAKAIRQARARARARTQAKLNASHIYTEKKILPVIKQDKLEVFKYSNKDLRMSNHRRISVSYFSKLLINLLEQNNKSGYISEIKLLVNKFGAKRKLKRNQLAIMSAVLVRAFPHKSYTEYSQYSDVKKDTVTSMALQTLGKVGIRMGYPNGRFGGNERVTGYEALKLVKTITKNITKANSVKVYKSAATKTDIEKLVNLIRNKRARVKRLFNRI